MSNGVLSAVRPRSFTDRSLTAASLFFYSTPTFLLGILLLYFLYYRLTLAGLSAFPAGGYAPLSQGIIPWAQHMILPWFTLALVSAATYTRLTRSSMLDVPSNLANLPSNFTLPWMIPSASPTMSLASFASG